MNLKDLTKSQKLLLGIFFDAVGSVTFFIPFIGEFADIIWAPASGYLMRKMYEGRKGRVASIIAFVEEALPFTDIIPTFTLMWLYTYVFSTNEETNEAVPLKRK